MGPPKVNALGGVVQPAQDVYLFPPLGPWEHVDYFARDGVRGWLRQRLGGMTKSCSRGPLTERPDPVEVSPLFRSATRRPEQGRTRRKASTNPVVASGVENQGLARRQPWNSVFVAASRCPRRGDSGSCGAVG